MAYWLVKSEPETWSWDDQVKAKATGWDGVRNHQAANNMKAMALGELASFYHSGDEKHIVGIVEVVKRYRPDTSNAAGRFGMVEVMAVKPFIEQVPRVQRSRQLRPKDPNLVRNSTHTIQPYKNKYWG